MADDFQINSEQTSGEVYGCDDIAGVKYPRVKLRLAQEDSSGEDLDEKVPASVEPIRAAGAVTRMKFSTGGTGDTVLVTGVSGESIIVTSFDASTTGTGDVFFKSASTAIFADGTNPITMKKAAGSGIQRFGLSHNPDGWFKTSPGEDLIVNQASPVPIAGSLSYQTGLDVVASSVPTGESVSESISVGHSFPIDSIGSEESVPSPNLDVLVGDQVLGVGSIASAESFGSPSSSAVLVPGTGWVGVTPQPAPVGNSGDDYYNVTPAARWHVVPYQTLDEPLAIGVLAFHANGINRVEMSVQNGPWLEITETSFNATSNAWEYVGIIDPSLFASDGQIEVRARIYPESAGQVRVLGASHTTNQNNKFGISALILFSNGGSTLSNNKRYVAASGNDSNPGTLASPYATVDKALQVFDADISTYDGGSIVITEDATYAINFTSALNNERWVNITRDPATTTKAGVIISNENAGVGLMRPGIKRWRMSDLTIDLYGQNQIYKNDNDWIYVDQVAFIHTGALNTGGGIRNATQNGYYVTNCTWTDTFFGPGSPNLCTGCHIDGILGKDCWNAQPGLVTHSTVVNADSSGPTHVDCYQLFDPGEDLENIILFGCKFSELIVAQTIFADDADVLKDSAFVNVVWTNDNYTPPSNTSQFNLPCVGCFFAHLTHLDSGMTLRDHQAFTATDVKFQNCAIRGITPISNPSQLPSGIEIDSCHFSVGTAWGTNVTIGDVTADAAGPSDEFGFTVSGAAVGELTDSAAVIPGLVTSDAVPDRGAWIVTDTGNAE